MLNAETGKFISSGTHRLIKNRNWLILAPLASMEVDNIVIEENDVTVYFETGRILISKSLNTSFDKNPLAATLDAKKNKLPLTAAQVEDWRLFLPFGAAQKEKDRPLPD